MKLHFSWVGFFDNFPLTSHVCGSSIITPRIITWGEPCVLQSMGKTQPKHAFPLKTQPVIVKECFELLRVTSLCDLPSETQPLKPHHSFKIQYLCCLWVFGK